METYVVRVWLPNDPTPYKMTFYADDAHHALEQYLDDPFPFVDVTAIDIRPAYNLEKDDMLDD